jgi:asparagine synthase (glutamine-hydrolysing)
MLGAKAVTRLRDMSAQFGKCNFDGKPLDPQELDRVRPVLAQYGPDAEGIFRKDNVGIIYRAFQTTRESRLENQPHVSRSGAVITWDGRLDNRSELIHELGAEMSSDSTDLSIVASAYDHWGTDSLAKLIGEWAVSIWSPRSQSLVLAKDFVGTRNLYYSFNDDQVTWSTILSPLVLFADESLALCEEYIAGWFSFFPATHLTPYSGIHSVPPSSSVVIRNGKQTVTKYWDFEPAKRIRYNTDAEYEEHFRAVFAEAVRRRLRSDSPILAELSGGMDSSSIVCMADSIIARGTAETPRLDTISYYDDSEPNWNERPYFTKVEEKRGRTGTHIDVGSLESFKFQLDTDHFRVTPGSIDGSPSEASRQFAACVTSQGNRVVLSGIGGDEVTGGVPTPTPELADLLARGHFKTLAHQLKVWALNKRKPWFYLLLDVARGFFPPALVGLPKYKRPAPWFNPAFVKRNRAALQGYDSRLRLFGSLPSFQQNASALEALQRQLGCDGIPSEPLIEKRYPYLDRCLIEFIYATPREQLVRPGQRRSLMRRALIGIVPDELLDRKRKAFVTRGPRVGLVAKWPDLLELGQHMLLSSLGIADSTGFVEALQEIRHGADVPMVPLLRTLGIEIWLRNLTTWRVLGAVATMHTRPRTHHVSPVERSPSELQQDTVPRETQTLASDADE